MILKKIAHKVAQAFRLAQAADKKLSTGIAAALDAKAEQLREYEKSFEPEPPEPDPLLEARTSLAQAGRIREAGEGGERIMAEVKIWPRGQTETGGILLMPMKKNIPKGHPEWSLVKCPICGQECWRPISRQELRQKKMQAACTECGLKIESRRNQP